MEHATGMVVHLDDDDVGCRLACDARELIRWVTDGCVNNDSLLRARYGLAEALQLSPRRFGVVARPGVDRVHRLQDETPERMRLNNVDHVQLRVVYRAQQV